MEVVSDFQTTPLRLEKNVLFSIIIKSQKYVNKELFEPCGLMAMVQKNGVINGQI